MALQRSTVRKLLVLCALCLVAITLGGAYLVQDNRVLLLLLPPSLTYFLLDAVKDAKHQKQLQAALLLAPVRLGQQGNGIYYGVCYCVWRISW